MFKHIGTTLKIGFEKSPMNLTSNPVIALTKSAGSATEKILTPQALQFLAKLHRNFDKPLKELLKAREVRQKQIDQGLHPNFLNETLPIRQDSSWQVASIPSDLKRRWVEITGPTERKMMINALNSGADVFMADFEDANAPTWQNMVEGQNNLNEAVKGILTFTSPEGKSYHLKEKRAVIIVRPRGWHLQEKHLKIDGESISASLFDFGLSFFHNAHTLIKQGSGPYFYLPKLENHREARLWNQVFIFAQEELGLPQGTIRATVLIETILAAFEMEEILYELKEHISGLNAGRWDYIFSIIKKFQNLQEFTFPDRAQITMTVPFMRAYTELLVRSCHKRGAYAMGGMAAFIPSRKDQVANEKALAKVREDKWRESNDGFDGTWVAHPDLVPVAHEIFKEALHGRANQLDLKRQEVNVIAKDLLNFHIPGGTITEAGLRQNISVAIQYLNAWINGIGAVAISNLMEDAATAEISRAQLWQWVHHQSGVLNDGRQISPELYQRLADEEVAKIEVLLNQQPLSNQIQKSRTLLDRLVLNTHFANFLTLEAYDLLIDLLHN